MLTFRHTILIGMLFVVCSCANRQEVATVSQETSFDFKSIMEQFEKTSKVIDAGGIRIEWRFAPADHDDELPEQSECKRSILRAISLEIDSLQFSSSEIRGVAKLDTCSKNVDVRSHSSKVVSKNNAYKNIFIVLILVVVMIIIMRFRIVS